MYASSCYQDFAYGHEEKMVIGWDFFTRFLVSAPPPAVSMEDTNKAFSCVVSSVLRLYWLVTFDKQYTASRLDPFSCKYSFQVATI